MIDRSSVLLAPHQLRVSSSHTKGPPVFQKATLENTSRAPLEDRRGAEARARGGQGRGEGPRVTCEGLEPERARMRTSPAVSAAPRAGTSPGGRRRTFFPGQGPQDRTRTRGGPQRPATTSDRGSTPPRERRRGERVACACTADHPYIKPSFDLEAEEVMLIQLDHLRRNNEPYVDHGIEVLYRFADIDPSSRGAGTLAFAWIWASSSASDACSTRSSTGHC